MKGDDTYLMVSILDDRVLFRIVLCWLFGLRG